MNMDNAPKDRRILAYGLIGLESEMGWSTVKWCSTYSCWEQNPTEATEYDPEPCKLLAWMELPEPPTTVSVPAPGSDPNPERSSNLSVRDKPKKGIAAII